MGKATRLYSSNKLPEFLYTHPVTTNRIGDAYGRAGDYPYRQRPDSLDYHLLKANLKLRQIDNPKQAINHFAKTLKEKRYRNREAQQYGYVLALMEDHRYVDARKSLNELLEQRPNQINYIVTNAQLQEKSGITKNHDKKITDFLFPERQLQERKLNIFSFLQFYGIDLIQMLFDKINNNENRHQIILID